MPVPGSARMPITRWTHRRALAACDLFRRPIWPTSEVYPAAGFVEGKPASVPRRSRCNIEPMRPGRFDRRHSGRRDQRGARHGVPRCWAAESEGRNAMGPARDAVQSWSCSPCLRWAAPPCCATGRSRSTGTSMGDGLRSLRHVKRQGGAVAPVRTAGSGPARHHMLSRHAGARPVSSAAMGIPPPARPSPSRPRRSGYGCEVQPLGHVRGRARHHLAESL